MASLSTLVTPVHAGAHQLSHRVAMSALTRLRMTPGIEAPNDLVKLYYEQRTSKGGLIVSECIYSSPDGRGYVRGPGLASEAQLKGWKEVVDAVHAKGGVIFAQLFHAGRVSHSDLVGGKPTVSPSALKMQGQLYVEGGVKKDYEEPRALTDDDILAIVQGFVDSAVKAVQVCGFDGVEVHGGNGYLIQQFMARKTNTRDGKYGGSVANRCRLPLEIIDAIAAKIGADKTAIKIQPGITFSDLIEPEEDVKETLTFLAPELARRKLAFVNLSSLNGEPYFRFLGLQAPNISFDPFVTFRGAGYDGTLMINGGLSVEQGEQYVRDGVADMVAYGVPFIANANLPELVAAGVKTAGLNAGGFDMKIWYGSDPAKDTQGYVDWPLVKP